MEKAKITIRLPHDVRAKFKAKIKEEAKIGNTVLVRLLERWTKGKIKL